MKTVYFTGYDSPRKAYLNSSLGLDNSIVLENIEAVLKTNNTYLGGYKGSDNICVLEPIFCYDASCYSENDVLSFCNEESIYKANIVNKVKIGDLNDKRYLICTIYDLLCSLTETFQGFTIYKDLEADYYLLICSQGEYIMNLNYNKEKQDETK